MTAGKDRHYLQSAGLKKTGGDMETTEAIVERLNRRCAEAEAIFGPEFLADIISGMAGAQ